MEAHERGMEAATKVMRLGIGDPKSIPGPGSVIKAYLEASNQVLVPREPEAAMKVDGGLKLESMMFEDDPEFTGVIFEDVKFIYRAMIDAAPNPFKDK